MHRYKNDFAVTHRHFVEYLSEGWPARAHGVSEICMPSDPATASCLSGSSSHMMILFPSFILFPACAGGLKSIRQVYVYQSSSLNAEKLKPLCTVGGNVKWYSYYGTQCGSFSKTKNRTTICPTILLLGIHPRELKVGAWRGACLFTIAKIWKQLQCPSTDEWIKKMWCIYTVEYGLAIKNGCN